MVKFQMSCRALDDDLRWLVAIISDTGMRLSEAVGLRQEDLHLDNVVPYLEIPRYCNETTCKSNSASAATNKWLKTVIGNAYVIHGLRHSFRDRLRNVGAPTDLIDQLGGWSLKTVGQGYGEGYSLELCGLWMGKLVEKPCPPPNSENCETD